VSSPAVIKPETSGRRVAPASRLIPGAPLAIAGMTRKQPRSVTVDGRFWVGEEPEYSRPLPNRSAQQAFVQAVLPGPFAHGQGWRLAGSMLADFLLLVLNFAVIEHLEMWLEFTIHRDPAVLLRPSASPAPSLGLLMLYGALLTLLVHSEGWGQADPVRAPKEERLILGKAVAWTTLLVGAAVHQSGIPAVSIAMLVASAPLNYLGMLGWRDWRRRAAVRQTESRRGVRNVLIVGAGRLGREAASYLQRDHVHRCVVRGFLDDHGPADGNVRGPIRDLARVARAEFVDEIIIAIPQQRDLARWVVQEARRNRLDVKMIPDLLGFEAQSPRLESFGNVPVLILHEEPVPVLGLFLKRTADIVLATASMLVAAPLLAAIALAIKLDSSGPVFYRAPRAGKKGRSFACCKFRTMVTDADKLKDRLRARNDREGPFFKMAHDPRTTSVGRLLRRYSLDELPQLWNVLTGEMSLVGPRPHPLDDFEHYDLEDLRRLDVTPGITGLWQVTARRDPSFQRNMALDLEYIEHWNLWMDVKILCQTVSVVLQGSGA
jgi:exopolysaccharide biosynthesis polyprenyl glycosylphosphotransferase